MRYPRIRSTFATVSSGGGALAARRTDRLWDTVSRGGQTQLAQLSNRNPKPSTCCRLRQMCRFPSRQYGANVTVNVEHHTRSSMDMDPANPNKSARANDRHDG